MPKQFTTDSPTIDEIMAVRKPRTDSVWVPLDADLLARIEQLEREVKIAERLDEREHRRPEAPGLRAQLDELEAEAEEAAVEFVFQEMPRKAYRTLKASYPDPAGKMQFDPETFPPALLAVCCTKPAMTAEQALAVWDEWGPSITDLLGGAAILVNEGPTRVPFGARSSAGTTDSAPSSTTAPPTE